MTKQELRRKLIKAKLDFIISKNGYNSLRTKIDSSEFKEKDHPRGKDGKFASGGGGGSSKGTQKKERRTHKKTGINNVFNYMEKELKKMGFEIETSGSGLSDSTYINITNWTDVTGKEGQNYNGELKIRISNHDLPPSYDRLHGFFDYDITDGIKKRYGSEGSAEGYDSALEEIAKVAKKETPSHIKKLKEQDESDKIKAEESLKKWEEEEKQTATRMEQALKENDFETYFELGGSKNRLIKEASENKDLRDNASKYYKEKANKIELNRDKEGFIKIDDNYREKQEALSIVKRLSFLR